MFDGRSAHISQSLVSRQLSVTLLRLGLPFFVISDSVQKQITLLVVLSFIHMLVKHDLFLITVNLNYSRS